MQGQPEVHCLAAQPQVFLLGIQGCGDARWPRFRLGDGGEAWTASYVINPATGALVSHQVHDGPAFHNQLQ